MPVIKFSHYYNKLYNKKREIVEMATLLDVVVVQLEDLSKEFLDYDTDDGLFMLPKKGMYLMLIFLKWGGDGLFTTLRRDTDEKREYYIRNIGSVYNVVVEK
jgi:hypothetical protein